MEFTAFGMTIQVSGQFWKVKPSIACKRESDGDSKVTLFSEAQESKQRWPRRLTSRGI
jgi:hypothetical protein